MNFANIYRENLSKLIEDETKKIYTEDQENTVFGLLIDAIKTIRFKNGLDMDGIVKKPLSLDDNDTELAEVLVVWKDLLVKNGVAEPEALSIANRENLKNKENVIKIVRACGAKEEKEPMLSLILNSFGVTGNLRVYYVEEYSKALLKAQKASADSKQKIKEAFRNFYLKKREAVSNEKGGKVLDEELFKKAEAEYKSFLDGNASAKDFFKKIDPELEWMDETFVAGENPDFIYSTELDALTWLSMVMSIETDINATSVSKIKPEDVQEAFKNAIREFTELEKNYKKFLKDNQKLIKTLDARRNALLIGAGGSLSAASLAFGAFTYGLGAFIPGGSYYAQYLSKLALWGRRAGKVISNAGSPLGSQEKKVSKNKNKDSDKKEKYHSKGNYNKKSLFKKDHHDNDVQDEPELTDLHNDEEPTT